MRRLYIFILGIAALFGISACNDGSAAEWNEMPAPIAQFVSKYFPRRGVDSYVDNASGSQVVVAGGPVIDFNAEGQWIALDGRGERLPEMFLFDQMPPQLYEYLQVNEEVDKVYRASRSGDDYTLMLLDSEVDYSLASGDIHVAYLTSK